MVWETDRLPNIVQDFLRYSDTLRKLVEKATWEIVEDIKATFYDQEIARWLGDDKISRQGQYHESLQTFRADQACEFLLENTNFTNWYDGSDSQQLVILGDMGRGKTVAMTFLVDELRRRKEYQLPQPMICYYYCWDNETGNATSIIPTLIISLLQQLPGLKKPFFDIKKLEEFLQKVLEAIDRPVFVIIDGLDECDTASRNRLLKLLKTLSRKISGLKTILSSRPQEEILEQLDEAAARIELGPDVQRDGIIVDKIVESKLSYLSMDVKALLSEPYVTIFSRCTSDDPKNEELASAALKLLAIARRPLSILELAWAVALGAAKHVTTIDDLAQLVDHQRFMSLIHPFITQVNFSDVKKRQVRLTHQSVKKFIIEKWTPDKPDSQGPNLTKSDQMIVDQRLESLETFILDICTRYLLLDDIDNRDLFSAEQVAITELPQEFDLFSDNEEPNHYNRHCTWETWEEDMIRYDPIERGFGEFFVYASSHWLEHFGAITVEPLPSLASIMNLCQMGSIRFRNWTQQNCRPGCTMTAGFRFDSSLYDPLSITSHYGSGAMLRDMLENSDFDKDKFLRNPAMEAADQIFQWGNISRLRILFLDDKLGHQLQNLGFFSTCHQNVE
ncbi:uncharacterized protein ASPGLDRAFT_77654 [Aspergillus glaucus CBS 516.65]|uniref:NACHT domain-containing protein n=1 Tax=Aspergillus glaucus CBS 516.65 TaxID=1160497 RepID=A0A1L9V685_ASPGL|nr:hypothetical protein ASPGLDRAFT_77654 [Aspergillus glaucus CBS 516.65]OJJ79437.1 hypothetical protein ASPGLDRAFT_77654 [Aspergillus glaucus CBS 516.65]